MQAIGDLCDRIVRPPKFKYFSADLEYPTRRYGYRADFYAYNVRNHRLSASFYTPHQPQRKPCVVVYLHSMNGSRLQSFSFVDQILEMGLYFCHFDFSGCGNSEGTSISFGANEKFDVYAVLQQVSKNLPKCTYILWGRSMGAVCAVKFAELVHGDPLFPIQAMLLDSPFISFDRLAVEFFDTKSHVPTFILKFGYALVKGKIEQKGTFKTSDLELVPAMQNLHISVMFLASREDNIVSINHSMELYEKYPHPYKQMLEIRGKHNEARSDEVVRRIKGFIWSTFVEETDRIRRIINLPRSSHLDNQNVECNCALFN